MRFENAAGQERVGGPAEGGGCRSKPLISKDEPKYQYWACTLYDFHRGLKVVGMASGVPDVLLLSLAWPATQAWSLFSLLLYFPLDSCARRPFGPVITQVSGSAALLDGGTAVVCCFSLCFFPKVRGVGVFIEVITCTSWCRHTSPSPGPSREPLVYPAQNIQSVGKMLLTADLDIAALHDGGLHHSAIPTYA